MMTVWILAPLLAMAPAGEQQVAIYGRGVPFRTLTQCVEMAKDVTDRAVACVEIIVHTPE